MPRRNQPRVKRVKPLSFPREPEDSVYNEFSQGDLVFGLQEPQQTVAKRLAQQGFHHTYAQTLNGKTVSKLIKTSTVATPLAPEEEAHFDFLQQHQAYVLRSPPGKPLPVLADNPVLGSAFRRACKLLLMNRDPDRTSRAHVVTDKVDWARVCDKRLSKGGITDSELRAAYRDYLKHGDHPHIFFYDSRHRRTLAPWKQPELVGFWRHYDEQRQRKRETQESAASAALPLSKS